MSRTRCLRYWIYDLHITHDRFGSSSDPSLNGNLHYPNNIDRSLNEDADDKIRKYHTDYNNNPPNITKNITSFISPIVRTSGRLHSEFVRLVFLHAHRETDRFFEASGVQFAQHDHGQFHFRHETFTQQLKNRVDLVLITSKSHTHPSQSQTSRLVTSSLSLGVPVPRVTQCM